MKSLMVAIALASAQPPAGLDPKALEQLERVYQQSCAERAYGSYSDLCDQMRREVRAFRRASAAEKGAPRSAPPPSTRATSPSVGPPSALAGAVRLEAPQSTTAPR